MKLELSEHDITTITEQVLAAFMQRMMNHAAYKVQYEASLKAAMEHAKDMYDPSFLTKEGVKRYFDTMIADRFTKEVIERMISDRIDAIFNDPKN